MTLPQSWAPLSGVLQCQAGGAVPFCAVLMEVLGWLPGSSREEEPG